MSQAASHHMAVQLLTSANSIAPFTQEEALALVRHMHPYTIPAGERFLDLLLDALPERLEDHDDDDRAEHGVDVVLMKIAEDLRE